MTTLTVCALRTPTLSSVPKVRLSMRSISQHAHPTLRTPSAPQCPSCAPHHKPPQHQHHLTTQHSPAHHSRQHHHNHTPPTNSYDTSKQGLSRDSGDEGRDRETQSPRFSAGRPPTGPHRRGLSRTVSTSTNNQQQHTPTTAPGATRGRWRSRLTPLE